MATSTSANPNAGPTVPLLLSTRTPYPLPPTRYLIPTSFTRFQLSQLINTSLSLSPPVPFDFLVRGQLLRGSLQQWLDARGQGAEETLEVEYVQSVLPPKQEASLEQDDWVSTVSLAMPGHILTGAYDNTVRIYSEGQELLHTLRSHTGAVTGLAAFNAPGEYGLGEGQVVASSSHDRSVHLHYIPTTGEPTLLTTLHTSPAQVSSVAVNAQGSSLVTATWDGLVGLFNTSLPTSHELPAEEDAESSRKKRRKLAPTATEGEEAREVFRKAPELVLRGHQGKVSKAVWDLDGRSVFSAGWDFTVRQWDAGTGVQGVVKTTPDRVHLTLGRMAGTAPLLATGTSDRSVCIFDLRAPTTVQLTLPHSSPVPSVVPHPTAPHLLTSATLSGVLQIWDLRAPRESLVRVQREGGKCLCVDWKVRGEGGEGLWATGGEDRKVQVWRTGTGGAGTTVGATAVGVERVQGTDVDGARPAAVAATA